MTKGFMVCKDCGAAMPGNDISVLNDINRPYKSKYARNKCRHSNCFNVNLGYDFITDMLVLEFTIDDRIIDARRNDNPWLNRAAQSLAEALRLVASKNSMLNSPNLLLVIVSEPALKLLMLTFIFTIACRVVLVMLSV